MKNVLIDLNMTDLHGDHCNKVVLEDRFTIHPRQGELVRLNKLLFTDRRYLSEKSLGFFGSSESNYLIGEGFEKLELTTELGCVEFRKSVNYHFTDETRELAHIIFKERENDLVDENEDLKKRLESLQVEKDIVDGYYKLQTSEMYDMRYDIVHASFWKRLAYLFGGIL